MRNWNFWGHPQKAILAGALALGLTGLGLASVDHLRSENSPVAVRLADPSEAPSHMGFAPVVERVAPAVVNISSSKVVKTPTGYFQNESMQQGDNDQSDDPSDMLRQFFGGNPFGNMGNGGHGGNMMPREQREQGLGSGVVVSPDGYILTNNHVVDGATDIRVSLGRQARIQGQSHRNRRESRYRGAEDRRDAICRPSCSAIRIECALATTRSRLGDPFGVGQTVTMGIVSAKGRTGLGIEAVRRLHPDRRADQPRQLGRRTGQRPRRTDRHQHRHSGARIGRQSGHRLRHSGQPGAHGDGCRS